MSESFYEKLNSRQKIVFLVTVCFVALALLDRLMLGPILAELRVLDSQIWAKQEALRRNLRVLSFRDSILEQYSKYEVYLDSGDKSREEIVSPLLHMIEKLAYQNEVTISNIQPGDVVENPLYEEYLTSIECEGTLQNILAFMDALEASDFLFRILTFEFIPKSKTGEVVSARIDISRILITAEEIPGRETPSPNREGTEFAL